MKPHVYSEVTYINQSIEEVFDFFSKAENLNLLTPPFLKFKILTPLPIKMGVGTFIDYKIILNGIPFKWKTKISKWEQNKVFVDEQIKGPYKVWIHEHKFEMVESGVKMTDTVQYQSPGWIFEPIINKLYIESKVKEIFAYRKKVLLEQFKD